VDMPSYHWNIGKMELWNVGYNCMEIKKIGSVLFFWFFGLFPLFHRSIIPLKINFLYLYAPEIMPQDFLR
jgi:hypothetical protein